MKHEDLPQRWKDKLQKRLISQGEHQRKKFSANDFNAGSVAKIEFEDGSYAQFNYHLVKEASGLDEVGVFIEHCEYHIFTLCGAMVVIGSRVR